MKEEWLFPGAMVPVDVETTAALVAEIKRLIDVVGGMALAQPKQEQGEPVAWMNNKDFEPIRVRIMQEAYELADRNDSEGYNAIKVMCGDVQRMLPPKRTWVGLTDEEIKKTAKKHRWHESNVAPHLMPVFRSLEAKLRSKNT